MDKTTKINIYKSMIQYFMDSTDYSLKRIAFLANSSVGNIQSLYRYGEMPSNFNEELDLVRLYMMILDSERRRHEFPGFNLYNKWINMTQSIINLLLLNSNQEQ